MDPVTFVRSQADRALAVLSAVVGLVLLVVGWVGVSGQGIIAGQIPYVVSCGLGGLFAIAIASTLWISADLRDEWRKMDAIEAAVLAQTEALHALQSNQNADPNWLGNVPVALPHAAEVPAFFAESLTNAKAKNGRVPRKSARAAVTRSTRPGT